jgi:REP element-mobilizing transposase RayT
MATPGPPGIYQFKHINGTDSYIGSTKDLFYRCFNQHKNHAFTNTNRHRLFYKSVIKNGWRRSPSFNLKILSITPDHSHLFVEQNPDNTITEK